MTLVQFIINLLIIIGAGLAILWATSEFKIDRRVGVIVTLLVGALVLLLNIAGWFSA